MFCSTDAGQWEVHTTGFQAHLAWSQGFRIACIHLKGFQCFWVSDCSHEIKLHLLLGRKAMTNIDSMLKSRRYFADKGPSSQIYGFSSSHVWM